MDLQLQGKRALVRAAAQASVRRLPKHWRGKACSWCAWPPRGGSPPRGSGYRDGGRQSLRRPRRPRHGCGRTTGGGIYPQSDRGVDILVNNAGGISHQALAGDHCRRLGDALRSERRLHGAHGKPSGSRYERARLGTGDRHRQRRCDAAVSEHGGLIRRPRARMSIWRSVWRKSCRGPESPIELRSAPGPIRTPGFEDWARGNMASAGQPYSFEAFEQELLKSLPNLVGRIGYAEEIADTVTFLSSPRAAFINGANIRVDGGSVPTTN